MKYLILRGFVDICNLLFILITGLAGLMFIFAITDQIAFLFTLLLSVKIAYYIWTTLAACLIQFIASLMRNYSKADNAYRTKGYSFEEAAKIIGRSPDAFEYYDP